MCASCGCGCKPGKEQKGCKCTCKTCREARMSVKKSFMVAKAHRDLEVFAKSFETPPSNVHASTVSAGQRYCDNGSCAICIKQKSRDVNAKQTALHVRKDDSLDENLLFDDEGNAYILVDVEDVEKSDKSRRYASNAAIGTGTAATGLGAGMYGAGVHTILNNKEKGLRGLGTMAGGVRAAELGALTAGVGGGLAGAGLGLRAYNKKKSKLVNRDKKV